MKTWLKGYLVWGMLLVLPCYILDQWTKWLICQRFGIGEGFTVISGFFDIIHVRNTGAAFGILQGIPENVRVIFFLLITVAAVAGMFYVFHQPEKDSWFLKAILSLILAGAVGNLTDRVLLKEVVDFLSFYIGPYRWPTFNLADTYISLGMVGLIIFTLFMMPEEGKDTGKPK